MRFLLDTNVLSEPVKPKPMNHVLERLKEHRGELCTGTPVWHELLFGCHRLPASKRRSQFEHYLRQILEPSIPLIPYDAQAASWHAEERARLEEMGRTPSFVDGQIAAVAAVNDLVLVTRNVRDFMNFDGLQIEDWSKV